MPVRATTAKQLDSFQSVERIMVRGVNWLGDAVMTTPALLRLRERFPSAHITLLTQQKLAELWKHHPSVNRVISIEPRDTIWSVAKRIRTGNFQLALVLPNSPRSAFEAWFARIPQRIGYARFAGGWTLTHALPYPGPKQTHKRSISEIRRRIRLESGPKPVENSAYQSAEPHQIYHYLRLTSALGANPEPVRPFIAVSDEEISATRLKFGLTAETDGGPPVFALNPGAEYGPAKRWPVQRFAEVARQIHQRYHCRWVIPGGKGDAALAAELLNAIGNLSPGVLNLTGQTSLRELCAVVKLSRVLITNDTGPMHLAAAVGTPLVAIFGSTSPQLTGPGLPGAVDQRLLTIHAPCAPCFRRVCPIDFRCMEGLDPSTVLSAAMSILESPSKLNSH